MKRVYKILRVVVLVAAALAVGLPVGLYLMMGNPLIQDKLRAVAEEELSAALGTKVTIARVDIAPLNRLRISDIGINDDFGRKCLQAKYVSTRFELEHFLRTRKIVIDYVELNGVHATLYRKSKSEPLNIQNIIRKLTKEDKNKKPARFSLAVNTIVLNDGAIAYDIQDAPPSDSGRFNPSHIAVRGLRLLAYLPVLSDTCIRVELERLCGRDTSGLTLTNLSAAATYRPESLDIDGLELLLPHSRIAIGQMAFNYKSPSELAKLGRETPVHLTLADNCHVRPSDLKSLLPALTSFDQNYRLVLSASGTVENAVLKKIEITNNANTLSIKAAGRFKDLTSRNAATIEDGSVKVRANAAEVSGILEALNASVDLRQRLAQLGDIDVNAQISGTTSHARGKIAASSGLGKITANINAISGAGNKDWEVDGDVDIAADGLNRLVPGLPINALTGNISMFANFLNGKLCGAHTEVDLASMTLQSGVIKDLGANIKWDASRVSGNLVLPRQEVGTADVSFDLSAEKGIEKAKIFGGIRGLRPALLTHAPALRGMSFTGGIDVDIALLNKRNLEGYAQLSGVSVEKADSTGIRTLQMQRMRIETAHRDNYQDVAILSDYINGTAGGEMDFSTIGCALRAIAAKILPVFVPAEAPGHEHRHPNVFDYSLTLKDTDRLLPFFGVNFLPVHPVTIRGNLDSRSNDFTLDLGAPYILNGEKIIENTALQAQVNGNGENGNIYLTTTFPTQKGQMTLAGNLSAAANRVDTHIDWQIARQEPIKGIISLSTLFKRNADNQLCADITFNPGDITFGSDIWRISPSTIAYEPGSIDVRGFGLRSGRQSIAIDGSSAVDGSGVLTVDLANIQTLSIFETLGIDNALIGGSATGRVLASRIFTKEPDITCPRLHVDSISYNRCVLGNADVRAWWDNTKDAFSLDAVLTSDEGRRSTIRGDIFAKRSALDIVFDADRVRVGFMKPFMAAFAEDLSGRASGTAHLFGTFKDIDLEARLFADNLGLKLGFTNVWYYATDSVIISPGRIVIPKINIQDRYGHTAQLDGYVTHRFFHEPCFGFNVSRAKDLLVYDINARMNPDWYGRIYGNGGAAIKGEPGSVSIDVGMSTAPGSTFTFVLSDNLQADDYTFITFRDRNAKSTDTVTTDEKLPSAVAAIRKRILEKANNEDRPSHYMMDIKVDITPDAAINLVMDPVGGDEIRSHGSGNMRMTYEIPGDELRLYGNYTIDRGSYNFTLQDIIIKDFTINEGSSIKFTGDPYSADLDIRAVYPVNANLSDLDESFLQDKDLNRTNVPVNAVLIARGDMRQPDISFDLEFPTLNSDVYRKVRSIVSTDEMMNRQIIYLLALNRFYTPEYMSATKGNELFSVASSTIASQLTNMLGKLADNWSIAPNLRSDRGDFSDVEVDVALSSTLLNNRLRLNGNFGYRDKSLNTNQFIGDFDIEYLFNRRGTWRLKAYNRYNDQNLYLRSAQTTQGLGIMFRREFDNMFNFLRPRRSKVTQTLPSDTLKTDTIHGTNDN